MDLLPSTKLDWWQKRFSKWLVIAFAGMRSWPLLELDVKFVFLTGPSEEEVHSAAPSI